MSSSRNKQMLQRKTRRLSEEYNIPQNELTVNVYRDSMRQSDVHYQRLARTVTAASTDMNRKI